MNSDELYTRAALYEIAKKCPPLKHIDLNNASTVTLRQLINKHTSASIVQLPILTTKLITRMVLQFISNRSPGFSEYIDYRTINVEVEPDELACLSNNDALTNYSTNIYLIVFKNLATGFIISAVDRMRSRVECSVTDSEKRLDPIRLPTVMTDTFTNHSNRNLDVDTEKLKTFGDFGMDLNTLKRKLERVDEIDKGDKTKRTRTGGLPLQSVCDPPLSAPFTPTLSDINTINQNENETQQTLSECRYLTSDQRPSSSFAFNDDSVDSTLNVTHKKQEPVISPPEVSEFSNHFSFIDDAVNNTDFIDQQQKDQRPNQFEFRPITPETRQSSDFDSDERSIIDSPISIQQNDDAIHLNEAQFVNETVGIDSFFGQINDGPPNKTSKTEVNDSFYDEDREEEDEV